MLLSLPSGNPEIPVAVSKHHVTIDNSVFSCGQIYVALSRVTSLDGLHLINFNPSFVFAKK